MKYIEIRNTIIGKGTPKICIPITGISTAEILKQAETCLSVPCDLVEWRGDWFEDIFDKEKVENLLVSLRNKLGKIPILFTFRRKAEGGEKAISLEEYISLNGQVAHSGLVDIIDGELSIGEELLSKLISDAHSQGVYVIASSHDFHSTPDKDEIIKRLRKMQKLNADLLKVAVMPGSMKDVLTLLDATAEMAESYAECPIVTMSMGALGGISRLAGGVFGSAITFGAAGRSSAPGQIPVDELHPALEIIRRNCQGVGQKEEADLKKALKSYNLFLIGFMGVGKSTVAKFLSDLAQLDQVEMDASIEAKLGMSIDEIFRRFGETHFRDLESQLLMNLQQKRGCIVSCGGGIVVRDENVKYMKDHGKIVLLTASPETILNRVKNSNQRPILNDNMNTEYIQKLMKMRNEMYLNAADIVVSTEDRNVAEICMEISRELLKMKE